MIKRRKRAVLPKDDDPEEIGGRDQLDNYCYVKVIHNLCGFLKPNVKFWKMAKQMEFV